jgi:hypothetical protein
MDLVTFLIADTTGEIAGSVQEGSFLGLVGSLFSGLVGGLIVLLVQTRQRNNREKEERQQELKGLLRIVDQEMSRNDDLLQEALAVDARTASGAEVTPLWEVRNLESRDWDNAKVRLARLADPEHFKNLDTYYRKARELAEFVQRLYSQSNISGNPKIRAYELTEQCKAASDAARQESRRIFTT